MGRRRLPANVRPPAFLLLPAAVGADPPGATMVRKPAHGRRPPAARALPTTTLCSEKRGDLLTVRGHAGGQPPAAAGGRLRCGGIPTPTRPACRCRGSRGCGCPCRSSTSTARPSRTTPTACSCAPRPWRWKKCSSAKCRAAALFYAEPRRREWVDLTPELRQKTQQMADEMNDYFAQ